MKILVVEDNALSGQALRDWLRARGHEADWLPSAAAVRHAAPPDVVLMDYMLSGVSGRDLLGQMRGDRRFSAVPVVVYTGAAGQDFRAAQDVAAAHPPARVVQKPVEPGELEKLLREAAGEGG